MKSTMPIDGKEKASRQKKRHPNWDPIHGKNAPPGTKPVISPDMPRPASKDDKLEPAPRETSSTFDLLSGGSCTIRGMMGSDEQMLSDPALMREGRIIDALLAAFIVDLDGSDNVTEKDVAHLFTVDRIWILIKQYQLSGPKIGNLPPGDGIEIVTRCTSKTCREKNESITSIERDLISTLRPFPENGDEVGASYDPEKREFTKQLSTGREITWGYSRGINERNSQGVQNPSMLDMLALRLRKIDGKPGAHAGMLQKFQRWELAEMRKLYEQTRAGVDTRITIFCKRCPQVYDVLLEAQMAFFFPGAR